ncbi:MAG: penicillin-binding protein 1A [Zoogloeaceae bacterium]|nr:penicillin-binding protein 1A [Zoogloeaceae bacterium]
MSLVSFSALPRVVRIILYPVGLVLGLTLIGLAIAAIVVAIAYPTLPDLDVLTNYQPRIPLRIYSGDGQLIGEFGEERRAPVKFQEVPDTLKQALLAAEDDEFYQHYGIDPKGILRALYVNIIKRGPRQGASTITQQVARNFFLTPEKTLKRKFYEALLTLKIEQNLSKDQIFELYINQIYLGQHAYGFAAASQIYYGKPLARISLAEAAMLAGLPKTPLRNPVRDPGYARQRQEYVLRRMFELGFITAEARQEALSEALVIKRDIGQYTQHAEYVAEMARLIAEELFPDTVYSGGLKVITTIDMAEQEAAWHALRQGVLDYDLRQGYRGAEGHIDLARFAQGINADSGDDPDDTLDAVLHKFPTVEGFPPAVVLEASTQAVKARIRDGETLTLSGDAIKFAARLLGDKAKPDKRLRPGSVIRLNKKDDQWQIAQLPEVEAAFVAIDPVNGRVRALVGGFDSNLGAYNRVTKAWRQPGSSFKPFIYSAALEKGFSPASVVPDEPLTLSPEVTGERPWEPRNYDGKYDGPITLRMGLARSKNMVSIRVLQDIGPRYAQDYVTRFGFDAARHPPYLTMALGAGSVTPWQMAAGYAVFANGGYRVNPYIVREIRNAQEQVLAQAAPLKAGDEKQRAIDPRNAYLMYSMLHDVAVYGTAGRASSTLKRRDLAGKTGTTNDYHDAWFCGFQKTIVGCAWVGFDQPRKLGSRETGGFTALPIWIDFMRPVLKDAPEAPQARPKGIVGAYDDLYYNENVPPPPELEDPGAPEEGFSLSAPVTPPSGGITPY